MSIARFTKYIRWALVQLSVWSGLLLSQGVGISETAITPDASAILELRYTSGAYKGFLLPRMTTANRNSIAGGSPPVGLSLYNTSTNTLDLYTGSWISLAPLSSPTFSGTVTLPSPFTLGATSVTATGTQLNYLSAATGTTGTTSSNLVFSNSPTLVTPTLGDAIATSINNVAITNPGTAATLALANNSTLATSGANAITLTSTGATNVTLPTSGTLATTGVLIGVRVLTTSGTYTPTAGTTSILVYAIGGGGAGGGSPNTAGASGSGGGAGGMAIKVYSTVSGSYPYTIGAGGTGVANAAGGNGGQTTFNVTDVVANGGAGGALGIGTTGSPVAGGAGGTATAGDILVQGMPGGNGVRLANTNGFGLAGAGGSTLFGSGGLGRAGGTAGNGNPGTGYGSGGGGAIGNGTDTGGDGMPGVIIVFEYK